MNLVQRKIFCNTYVYRIERKMENEVMIKRGIHARSIVVYMDLFDLIVFHPFHYMIFEYNRFQYMNKKNVVLRRKGSIYIIYHDNKIIIKNINQCS